MAVERFERSRQLAGSCQDYYVCQFHHTAEKSGGTASAKLLVPLFTLQARPYHRLGVLSSLICG